MENSLNDLLGVEFEEYLHSQNSEYGDSEEMRDLASRADLLSNDAAVAVAFALGGVLPQTLLKALAAGGDAGLRMLEKQLRAAEFDPDQPRDEQGQWTSGGGSAGAIRPSFNSSGADDDRLLSDARAVLPERVYRGTGPGTFDETSSRMHGGGELGGGIYLTPSKETADGYSEGPGHVTHEIEWARPLNSTEIGYVQGIGKDLGNEVFSEVRLVNGDGKELWRGDLTGDGWKTGRQSLNLRAKDNGVMVLIGATGSGGEGQIAVLDRSILKPIVKVLAASLRTTAGPLASLKMRFDAANEDAAKWAKKHAAKLIKDVSETTRRRVRLAVEEVQEDGDWELYKDRVLHAVGDEERANLIARHESHNAASEGQRQGWNQAVEEGLLTGDERRVWIVVGDEKVCPICEGLDGTRADLGGEYEPGIEGPPAHVACRCTEGIA